MLALISPAKSMQSRSQLHTSSDIAVGAEGSFYTDYTEPRFGAQTDHIVSLMLSYSAAEIAEIFRVSGAIARQLQGRFMGFYDNRKALLPAVESYNGVVYKHFKESINAKYLQDRVRISSLLYGLLRPFDLIQPYRMEGFVRLADTDERVDKFWRDIQTQTLIDDVTERGGTLLYLASQEEQNAFHWREVESKVRVIDVKFLQNKGDKLRQVVVYTKMARGEMIRYMMEHEITSPDLLKSFKWGGYQYSPSLSTPNTWVWINQ